jgi:hypothetical protein
VIATTAASIVVEIVLLYFLSRNRFDFRFNAYKVLIGPAILLSVIVITELTMQGYENLRHLMYCVLCILVLLVVYRAELKNLRLSNLTK